MKLLLPIIFSALSALSTVTPLPDPQNFFYKPLTFTFYGGPASYQLSFPADGNTYNTDNNLTISLISAPSFNAYAFCNFYTAGNVVVPSVLSEYELAVGPPQPIFAVNCAPTPGGNNTCLPVYASCEWWGIDHGGCELLYCCSGYCAGTKCRSTTDP